MYFLKFLFRFVQFMSGPPRILLDAHNALENRKNEYDQIENRITFLAHLYVDDAVDKRYTRVTACCYSCISELYLLPICNDFVSVCLSVRGI